MLLNFILQTETAAAAAEAVTVEQNLSFSLIDMAFKGGWLMIPLVLLSILTIYIFAQKWWMIKKASKFDENFMRNIRDYIFDGKIKSATALCEKTESPIARLIEKGLDRMGKPMSDIQTAVENTANVEVARLEKGLTTLATIAGGAPMIGFLGTVVGMVQAFYNMSQAGNNIDITLLSGGIYTAMVTTVAGLIVGILAYFGYNYLTTKVSDIVYNMQYITIEFLDMVQDPESKKAE
jgi:Biopolymer transport proteins